MQREKRRVRSWGWRQARGSVGVGRKPGKSEVSKGAKNGTSPVQTQFLRPGVGRESKAKDRHIRMTSPDKTGEKRPRRACTRDGYGCVPASRVLPARECVLRGCVRLVALRLWVRGGCWIKGWMAMAMPCQPTA